MENNSHEDRFTATQVMVMFESLQTDISAVAENVTSLREDVTILKTDVTQLKIDMTAVKDFIRIEYPSLERRVTTLEKKTG